MNLWSILSPIDIFYGHFDVFFGHLVHFPHFGVLYQEQSGNSARL
jgi:hypothetical protein